ncbi:beta-1,3-galactosyltransferase 5 [Coccinella septempunctata]|uniref:beta-1,3-galactosyltransferase 5 n=1 Tax=Coccinella septempunctata TaxID=41139 RepID=UPI001D087AFD|nr:beta-1,3-galactosyltransferase 5 [Coccinella septempunctata]
MLKLFKRYLFILTLLLIIVFLTILFFRNVYQEIIPEQYHETRNYHFKFLPEIATRNNNLFDIADFTFLLKPDANVCLSNEKYAKNLRATIIVTSHINNVEVRSAMRRAFSENDLYQLGVCRVFLLGITPDNKYINQKAIEDEARRFGDIVQGNFHEAYRNLTYKHIMGLRWVNQYCPNTQFVIKMDDDIVVYFTKLLELLEKFDANKEFLSGYVLKDLKVKRIKANKWYVTKDEYAPEIYPQFVSGWLYIITPAVSKKLEQLARQEKYFWIDDVFVTGILAEKINLKIYDIKEIFTDHPEYFQCCMNDYEIGKLDCDIIVGPNGGRTNLFYEFNKMFSLCKKDTCIDRLYKVNNSCTESGKKNFTRGSAIISAYKLIK